MKIQSWYEQVLIHLDAAVFYRLTNLVFLSHLQLGYVNNVSLLQCYMTYDRIPQHVEKMIENET